MIKIKFYPALTEYHLFANHFRQFGTPADVTFAVDSSGFATGKVFVGDGDGGVNNRVVAFTDGKDIQVSIMNICCGFCSSYPRLL